jgi:hypothetical protein
VKKLNGKDRTLTWFACSLSQDYVEEFAELGVAVFVWLVSAGISADVKQSHFIKVKA